MGMNSSFFIMLAGFCKPKSCLHNSLNNPNNSSQICHVGRHRDGVWTFSGSDIKGTRDVDGFHCILAKLRSAPNNATTTAQQQPQPLQRQQQQSLIQIDHESV